MRTIVCLAGALLWTGAAATQAAAPALPFSPSVRVGDVLYLSGQIGVAPGAPGPAAGGLAVEARQAMDNIGGVLRANGLSFRDIFKCTVMLTDMTKWSDFNRVYTGFFAGMRLPARSAIGANALALGAQVEVDCLASFPATPQVITARRSPPSGPYSTAVATGGLVFVSGVVPYDSVAHSFAPSDFASQMRAALANLDAAIEAAGARRSDVVKTTVFLRDPADMAAMNTAYAAFFGAARPARTTVPGVDWGRPDIRIEIEAIVAAPARTEETVK